MTFECKTDEERHLALVVASGIVIALTLLRAKFGF